MTRALVVSARQIIILATAVAVAFLAVAASGAEAATVSQVANPSATADADTCPDGTKALAAASIAVSKYGSKIYTYESAAGTFQDVVPPSSFNPLTASPDELISNYFSPRPSDAAQLADWTATARAFRGARQTAPSWCTVARTNSVPSGIIPLTHTSSSIWSGYENTAGGFQKATATMPQPTVANTPNSAASTWVGLNAGPGANNGALVQAGVYNLSSNPTKGAPFWEEYCSNNSHCNSPQFPSNVQISAGNQVAVSVSYNPASGLSYYAVFVNGTQVVNVQYSLPAGFTTGGVVDFMTEKEATNLPNFGSWTFNVPETYNVWNGSAGTFFGNQAFTGFELTNDGTFHNGPCSANSHILAIPLQDGVSAFHNQFCRSY